MTRGVISVSCCWRVVTRKLSSRCEGVIMFMLLLLLTIVSFWVGCYLDRGISWIVVMSWWCWTLLQIRLTILDFGCSSGEVGIRFANYNLTWGQHVSKLDLAVNSWKDRLVNGHDVVSPCIQFRVGTSAKSLHIMTFIMF